MTMIIIPLFSLSLFQSVYATQFAMFLKHSNLIPHSVRKIDIQTRNNACSV